MRYLWLGMLTLTLGTAAPAWSQDRPQGPPRWDSMQGGKGGGRMDGATRERIERRFAERVREELRLTNDQTAKLKATTEQYAQRRKELRTQERTLRKALADQLQPGVAAKNDSVAQLTDDLVGLRLRYAENFRDELRDLSKFLTPVQRARLVTMRERVLRAADRARDRRMGPPMERHSPGRQPRRDR